MNKLTFVLIFEQGGYAENGGGVYVERFDTVDAMDERVNKLLTKGQCGETVKIQCAFMLAKEYEYTPVEKVTVYERKTV